jgi:hypothetical protein
VKPVLSSLVLGLGLATASASPAAAYPVDCAILLCLAGGWPTSAECAHARAVVIQRITPWPIEPPLQLWNCPIRAAASVPQAPERLFEILGSSALSLKGRSSLTGSKTFDSVVRTAGASPSGPILDVVKSIRLFEISYQQRRNSDQDCIVRSSVVEGRYSAAGDYRRRRVSLASVPENSDLAIPAVCRSYSHRSVFLEWRDIAGTQGHEEVHY